MARENGEVREDWANTADEESNMRQDENTDRAETAAARKAIQGTLEAPGEGKEFERLRKQWLKSQKQIM